MLLVLVLLLAHLCVGRCHWVACPVWVRECVEEGVEAALHQLNKRLLDGVLPVVWEVGGGGASAVTGCPRPTMVVASLMGRGRSMGGQVSQLDTVLMMHCHTWLQHSSKLALQMRCRDGQPNSLQTTSIGSKVQR